MHTKLKNIFSLIPEDLSQEIFETILKKENIKIERIISKGHTSPVSGWHQQKQNEWVLVLKGSAIISFEGTDDIKLNEGSHLDIPALTKHRVSWTQPETETIWLAIFYSN